jgi:hypothetical protein
LQLSAAESRAREAAKEATELRAKVGRGVRQAGSQRCHPTQPCRIKCV